MGPGGIVFCCLFLKARYVPGMLAIWGIITYSTMLALSLANILFPNLPEMISIALYTPGALFEVTFGLWLLFKGVNVPKRSERVAASS